MRFETKKLSGIKPYANNPRENDAAVPAVIESIKQCGYIAPIIVDENNVILAGHTRFKALMTLGIKEAKVLTIEGLSEEQKKKYRYLDNKVGETATWDLLTLEKELESLDLGNLDFFSFKEKGELLEYETDPDTEYEGAVEYDIDNFDDEKFKYCCPGCGFKFN